MILEALNDRTSLSSWNSWRQDKGAPFDRICDLAAEIVDPSWEKQPAYNPQAPRAQRDQAIEQLKKRWKAEAGH